MCLWMGSTKDAQILRGKPTVRKSKGYEHIRSRRNHRTYAFDTCRCQFHTIVLKLWQVICLFVQRLDMLSGEMDGQTDMSLYR